MGILKSLLPLTKEVRATLDPPAAANGTLYCDPLICDVRAIRRGALWAQDRRKDSERVLFILGCVLERRGVWSARWHTSVRVRVQEPFSSTRIV